MSVKETTITRNKTEINKIQTQLTLNIIFLLFIEREQKSKHTVILNT